MKARIVMAEVLRHGTDADLILEQHRCIVVSEGDPTRDITDLAHVRQVVRMGALVEEGALRKAAVPAFERAPRDVVSRMILEVAGPD